MSATPMPESARPPVSIPFNLYFHGLDKPAWSAEADGINATPAAAEAARKTRALVSGARRRQIAGLHDSVKRLDKAAYELASLDETGFVDVAAQHLDRRLAHTVAAARAILKDIEAATRGYRTVQASPADADQEPVDDDQDEAAAAGYEYHCEEHGFHVHGDPEAARDHEEDHLEAENAARAEQEARGSAIDQAASATSTPTEAMNALGEEPATEVVPRPLSPEETQALVDLVYLRHPAPPTPADVARRTAMAPVRMEWPFQ